jgi:serine/threonine protein kinase
MGIDQGEWTEMENPKAPSHLIDTELAGCRIVDEIGRGGMAVVYQAYQTRLERLVAIKVLRPDLVANEEVLARFRREARAVAALRHPNILTIYDYGEERGMAYIVMEYVTGVTLKERLDGKPWEWLQAVSLLIPLGQALAYAHTQGIIHRDFKPANILLPRDDWPLLSDFGLVKLLEGGQTITQPGVGLGTPLYTAPEQMLGEEVDHRADIYSLGMVLYEMVTGRLPFKGDTPVKLMVERLNQPPVPPRQVNPSVTPQLEELLLKTLAPAPADRFDRTDELVAALEELRRAALQGPAPGARRATQVIQRDQLTLGPRLSIAGTGVLLALSPDKESLVGRSAPYSDQVPAIDLSSYGGGQAGVSRLHAKLTPQEGQWYLEDLKSTNGTFVNGQPLVPGQPVALNDGDFIQFGRMSVTFYSS